MRAPARRPAAAGAHDPVQNRRARNAFEFMWAFVFDDEQARDLSPHGRRDEHRSRLGGALHPSGEVWRVAKHLAGGIHDDRTAIEPDAGGERGESAPGVRGVQVFERAKNRQARARGAFRIILLRPRISEQRHEPVAELFGDMAAVLANRLGGVIEIGADEVAPVLGVERAARLVDPTKSQNITVMGRRSALSRARGAAIGLAAAAPGAGRFAIAFRTRLRSPSGKPSFSRSFSFNSRTTSMSIKLSRNAASCRSRPSPWSQVETSMTSSKIARDAEERQSSSFPAMRQKSSSRPCHGIAHDLARVGRRLQVAGDDFVERRTFRTGDLDDAVSRRRQRRLGDDRGDIVRCDRLEQDGRKPDDVPFRAKIGDATQKFHELGRADNGVGEGRLCFGRQGRYMSQR